MFGEALDAFEEHSEDEATLVARALSSAAQAWSLSLLGRREEGTAAAAAAADTLRTYTDSEALWLALQCRAINLVYLGRIEELIAVADEGIALGETLDGPFWAAVFKQWRGGTAILAGDFDTGRRVLLEAMEVYQQLDEQYWMSANLQHQAQIALPEGRIDDAIDLLSRSVDKGRQIGGVRILQMSLTALGDANIAAGNLEAGETAFIEGLATSEEMGLVLEMLGLILKIANSRAASGQKREAVELLATVLAEPISAQQAMWESAPIDEIASAVLAELQRTGTRRILGCARGWHI